MWHIIHLKGHVRQRMYFSDQGLEVQVYRCCVLHVYVVTIPPDIVMLKEERSAQRYPLKPLLACK
jgi:hypothetical protein